MVKKQENIEKNCYVNIKKDEKKYGVVKIV
jgi:hypothetical protein